jgi:hypothetical protein
MTAKMLIAQRNWQTAGSKAAQARWSYSKPRLTASGGPVASRSYRKAGRTSKIRGKAAIKHTASNFTPAPAVAQILSGSPVTHGLKEFDSSTIRGDVVQSHGTPYRKAKKATTPKKVHIPSFKGHQLTKKGKK